MNEQQLPERLIRLWQELSDEDKAAFIRGEQWSWGRVIKRTRPIWGLTSDIFYDEAPATAPGGTDGDEE